MMESPAHIQYDATSLRTMGSFFNWTMTYRMDSTFPVPYGGFYQVGKDMLK